MTINNYYTELMQDIHARAGAEQNFTEAEFTERICDFLVDQATIENYTLATYKNSPRGIRVDAWDYNEDTEALSLFVTDFRFNNDIETLSSAEVTRNFRRIEKYFNESLNINFLAALEESAPGYELAREIYDKNRSKAISRVNFFFVEQCSA